MARVNVEQKALTDSRFGSLGLMLLQTELGEAANDVSIETAQCVGVGRMVRVWNACQERNTYTLSEIDLLILLGHQESGQFLIDCGLGQRMKGGGIRVCGTKGRIEWLAKSRENGGKGAEHGVKGGRPKLTPHGVIGKPPVGLAEKPPPAPALTPTKKKEQDKHSAAEIVEGFKPGAEHLAWALTHCPSVPVITETEAWRDRLQGNGYLTGKNPVRNAAASWRTGMRNAELWGTYARPDRRGVASKTAAPVADSSDDYEISEFAKPGTKPLQWVVGTSADLRLRGTTEPDPGRDDLDSGDLHDVS